MNEPTNKELKTPTIEEQIRTVIAENMMAFHEENKGIIETTIKDVVNGKIDKFREEQSRVNIDQDKQLKEIKKSIEGVLNLYNGSNNFFRVTKTIAIWCMYVGGGASAVWAFIKIVWMFVINYKK